MGKQKMCKPVDKIAEFIANRKAKLSYFNCFQHARVGQLLQNQFHFKVHWHFLVVRFYATNKKRIASAKSKCKRQASTCTTKSVKSYSTYFDMVLRRFFKDSSNFAHTVGVLAFIVTYLPDFAILRDTSKFCRKSLNIRDICFWPKSNRMRSK